MNGVRADRDMIALAKLLLLERLHSRPYVYIKLPLEYHDRLCFQLVILETTRMALFHEQLLYDVVGVVLYELLVPPWLVNSGTDGFGAGRDVDVSKTTVPDQIDGTSGICESRWLLVVYENSVPVRNTHDELIVHNA